MSSKRASRLDELIIDNFAGGGGASTGIELALGRSPDVAINHDPEALAMHELNHPRTRHYKSDVFDIDPRVVTRMRPVGLAWFSPDCTHHSKARGCKPIRQRGKKSRSLAWIVVKWALLVRPRVLMLENVEEFQEWGPVIPKKHANGKPVKDTDGAPLFVPCPDRRGRTFQQWVRKLQRLNYVVEWRELRACDYGAPTIRKRLFVIARCDGKPIVWPEPTHGKPTSPGVLAGKLLPWRTAAEIIDWSLPCPSIFLTPEEAKPLRLKRPLKENTLKRIAAGVKKYVLEHADPFIVYANHGGEEFRGRGVDQPMATVTAARDAVGVVSPFVTAYHGAKSEGDARGQSLSEPLRTQDTGNRFGLVAPVVTYAQHGGLNRSADAPLHTITGSRKDQNCVVAPYLVSPAHSKTTGRGPNHWSLDEPVRTVTSSNDRCVVSAVLDRQFGNSTGAGIDEPVGTVMPGGDGKTALVQAFLAQHNTGVVGRPADAPVSTITQRGTQQQVVECAFVSHQRTSNTGGGDGDVRKPVNCLTSGGQHLAAVRAFLCKYYGQGGQWQDCRDPVHTVPTRDRLGVVTVKGELYELADIGMRMFTPRELFNAQGFPATYRLDVWCSERRNKAGERMKPGLLPKDSLVRMCGNSVCPDMAAALVRANCPELKAKKRIRRQLELKGT
jgi:DNA (cytosine-5)-methyltransferase 1